MLDVIKYCKDSSNTLKPWQSRKKNNEKIDKHYHELVLNEVQSIQKLVAGKEIEQVAIEEVSSAIKCINQGKSPDYYGLTIEHISVWYSFVHVVRSED